MKIKTLFLSGAVAVMLVSLWGCGLPPIPVHYEYKSIPVRATVENEQYAMSLAPDCNGYSGCKSFMLTIRNKTNKNIELNWNKTLYIKAGQTSGGFMFEGVLYSERNNPKQPDIIFGNDTFTKNILPCNLVFYETTFGGWGHGVMHEGNNGAYITLSIDDKEVSERLIIQISKYEIPK